MKLLFLLIIPICVFSLPLFSAANSVLHTDKDPFFKDSADLVAHSPEVAEMTLVHHQDLNKKILIALVVSSSFLGGVLLLLSCFVIYRFKRLKKCKAKTDQSSVVKKIYAGRQEAEREFENEVQLLSKIQHQCIVSLLGYCIHDEARFLVYEMMENGSLEFHLHGPSHGSALTWHQRIKIALDVARGLEYLHEHCNPPVIHRDLKSSNILLDSNFNAKISDFGLAIKGGNSNKTDITLSGTLGYVAPECLLDGKLTDKSDVYAFGVVLLELLMGRRPVEKVAEAQCQSIVTWATPQLNDRSKLPNIIDPAIWNTMDLRHLYQVAAIAVLCIQPEPSYRPLITDVLHSFIPPVPVELGGSLQIKD